MNDNQSYERNRKRKIFLSILMILFVGIVLTASTYAWFTANQTVTVSTIDVNVAAQNGLQISTDGTSWKTVITNEDLLATLGSSTLYPGNSNMLPFRGTGTTPTASIVPVSTTGGNATSGKLDFYIGSVDSDINGNELLTATKMTENKGQEGSLVAFDLFFQVTQDSPVYLTRNSAVTVWNDGNGTTTSEETDKGLQNAARVAWLREGNSPIGTTLSTVQGQSVSGALTSGISSTTGNVIIWEPNRDTHSTTGIAHAANVYGKTVTATGPAAGVTYKGIKAPISTGVALNNESSTYFGDPVGLISSTSSGGVPNNTAWFTLKAGISKVRFYLWIEGQDVDCENNASGQSLSYDMQFSLLESV